MYIHLLYAFPPKSNFKTFLSWIQHHFEICKLLPITSRGIKTKVTKNDVIANRVKKKLVDTVPKAVDTVLRSLLGSNLLGPMLGLSWLLRHIWYRGTLQINQYSVICPGVRSRFGSRQGFRGPGPAYMALCLDVGCIRKPPGRDSSSTLPRMKIHQLIKIPIYTWVNWGRICQSPKRL